MQLIHPGRTLEPQVDLSDRYIVPPKSRDSGRFRLLELLSETAGELLASDDVCTSVARIFDSIREALHVDIFLYYRLDGDALILDGAGGIPGDARRRIARVALAGTRSVDASVARGREMRILDHVQGSASPATQALRALGVGSYAAMPLLHGEVVLGTLGFGRRNGMPFDSFEVQFLQTVTRHLALARHRVRVEQALRTGLAERDRLLAEHRELHDDMIELTRISAMGTIAATAAHELNQPLAAAANYVSAVRLGGTADPGRVEELTRAAEQQLLRAGAIIRRLRRIVSGDAMPAEPQDLGRLCGEAIHLVAATRSERETHYRLDLRPDAQTACVEPVHLMQLLATLLRNAADAAGDDGEVEIRSRRGGADAVELAVVFRPRDESGPATARLRSVARGLRAQATALDLRPVGDGRLAACFSVAAA